MGFNNIGDEGAKALAVTFETNLSLKSIGLHRNTIGDAGAKALAVMLKKNQSLESLQLDLNCIKTEAKTLLRWVWENTDRIPGSLKL